MHNHWKSYLSFSTALYDTIVKDPDALVVECGAGHGDLTNLLVELKNQFNFRLSVISDNSLDFKDVDYRVGISYKELEKFPDNSIDFCIIDTDHNYWTLSKELTVIHRKLKNGGMVALHDVSTYYHDTGMALSYWEGSEYPKSEIEDIASQYGGLGNALIDFLSAMRFDYKLISFTSESHGAALIKKVALEGVSIMVPGENSEYAQNC